MAGTVGEMTHAQLSRFIQQAIYTSPANLPRSLTGEDIESTITMIVSGDIKLSPKAIATLKTYLGL